MGPKDPEARVTKVLKLVARRLCAQETNEDVDEALLDPPQLRATLQRALTDLPLGNAPVFAESDLDRYVKLLLDEICLSRPDLAARCTQPAAEREELPCANIQDGKLEQESLPFLLEVVQGPLLTNSEYARAVDALIKAADSGAEISQQAQEWQFATSRILLARPNCDLTIWWAVAAVEMAVLLPILKQVEDKVSALASLAKTLFTRLKGMIIGHTSPEITIAVLAPLVGVLFIGLVMMSKAAQWQEGVKDLETVCKEVIGFVALYRHTPENMEGSRSGSLESNKEATCSEAKRVSSIARMIKAIGFDTGFKSDTEIVFPLAPKLLYKSSCKKNRSANFWANIVSAELILLHLITKIINFRGNTNMRTKDELLTKKILHELHQPAVHGLYAIGTSKSYGILLDLLSRKVLPTAHILDAEEELLLRDVICKAVLVNEPCCYNKTKYNSKETIEEACVLVIQRVAVARKASERLRSQGERSRALDLFSKVLELDLPPHFAHWLCALKIPEKPSEIITMDKSSLLGWLLNLQNDLFKKLHDKCLLKSRILLGLIATKDVLEIPEEAFIIDKVGDINTADNDPAKAMNTAFADAAQSMRNMGLHKSKKKGDIIFERYEHTMTDNNGEENELTSDNEDDIHQTGNEEDLEEVCGTDSMFDNHVKVKTPNSKSKRTSSSLSPQNRSVLSSNGRKSAKRLKKMRKKA